MTKGEKNLCYFKQGGSGSFVTALFEAIFKADLSNQIKLGKAFPEKVTAVLKFQNEDGYWENLQKEFNKGE